MGGEDTVSEYCIAWTGREIEILISGVIGTSHQEIK